MNTIRKSIFFVLQPKMKQKKIKPHFSIFFLSSFYLLLSSNLWPTKCSNNSIYVNEFPNRTSQSESTSPLRFPFPILTLWERLEAASDLLSLCANEIAAGFHCQSQPLSTTTTKRVWFFGRLHDNAPSPLPCWTWILKIFILLNEGFLAIQSSSMFRINP